MDTLSVVGIVLGLVAIIGGSLAKGAGLSSLWSAAAFIIVILGTIANRSGKKVEYLPQSMTFKDASLNHYIREPVRKGWEYGEGLLKS